jgi:hypothetical protein
MRDTDFQVHASPRRAHQPALVTLPSPSNASTRGQRWRVAGIAPSAGTFTVRTGAAVCDHPAGIDVGLVADFAAAASATMVARDGVMPCHASHGSRLDVLHSPRRVRRVMPIPARAWCFAWPSSIDKQSTRATTNLLISWAFGLNRIALDLVPRPRKHLDIFFTRR